MDAEVGVLEKQQRFDESAGLRINEIEEQRAALEELLDRTTQGTRSPDDSGPRFR